MRNPSAPAALRLIDAVQTIAGDPDSSLGGFNVSELQDGALVFCIENGEIYRYDPASVATPNGASVVAASPSGSGNWLSLMPASVVQKTQVTVNFGSTFSTGANQLGTVALPGAQDGDVVALSSNGDALAGLSVSDARITTVDQLDVLMGNLSGGTLPSTAVVFDVALIR